MDVNKLKANKWLLVSLFANFCLVVGLSYLVHRLGGLKFMWHRINNGGLAGVYENRNNLFQHLKLEKGSIVFLGDSITEYGQWEELMLPNKVKNRGIAGDTTWGLLRRLQSITSTNPTAIFLMIGVNDFLFTQEEEIVENYTKIIQQIKKECPNTQLFIQSVLPINSAVKKNVFSNKAIQSLNQNLQKLAEENGLIYIDLHQKLLNEHKQLAANFTADGVHINGEAYTIWKNTVAPYIDQLNTKK